MIRFLYSYKFVRSTLVYWIRTHIVSPGSGPASFRLDPDPHHFAWIRTRVVSPGSPDPRHFAWIRTGLKVLQGWLRIQIRIQHHRT